MTLFRTTLAATALACSLMAPAWAETTATDAWVRATVAQQRATGLFVKLQSTTGGKLVGVSSPIAGVAEVHEMRMDGNVMRMRALADGLDLPAGETVELKPGGYHVMLMDLKAPVQQGQTVDVTLTIQTPNGQTETLVVKAPAKAMGAAAMGHGHKH